MCTDTLLPRRWSAFSGMGIVAVAVATSSEGAADAAAATRTIMQTVCAVPIERSIYGSAALLDEISSSSESGATSLLNGDSIPFPGGASFS